MKKKKIIFFVNHATFFVSHRINLALAARKKGFDVELMCGNGSGVKEEKVAHSILKKNKIRTKNFKFYPSQTSIYRNIILFIKIFFHFKREKPDIVHLISPIAILIGGLASKLASVQSIVISFSGMGLLFTNNINNKFALIKFFYIFFLKIIFKKKNLKIVVQNKNDKKFFLKKFNLNNKNIFLIKGSGVDINKYKNISIKNKNKSVVLISRIIKEKGISEFVEAIKILNKSFKDWKYFIVGPLFYNKPTAYSKKTINEWKKINNLYLTGFQKNIFYYLKNSSIICLPSYREGMPKTLLEASASGRPIVTTDAIGCRDAIEKNITGILCKVGDSISLAKSLEKLIKNKKLREKFGRNGRKKAIKEYDINDVTKRFITIYKLNIK